MRIMRMDRLPEELIRHIHSFRPVHPCAAMVRDFYTRIGYSGPDDGGDGEAENLPWCLEDYRHEPDYFDVKHDGKRGCVPSFYGFGDEWDDPRVHGGRGPRCVVPPRKASPPAQRRPHEWELRGVICDGVLRWHSD